ncbi:MAG: hypothetical protein CM15mP74_29850 [Halieaceae bacterium]|nr:MAG: hypothetical protein CM15mP74_29850 [Halieaceae bacterium]
MSRLRAEICLPLSAPHSPLGIVMILGLVGSWAEDQALHRPTRSTRTARRLRLNTPDFSETDRAFEAFLEESSVFDGISYVVVDADGTLHTGTFGDHTEDTVVMLASTARFLQSCPCSR